MEVVVSPQIAGVQWSNTVGSTLWGMTSCVTVILDIVLGLAEIAPASCQPRQAAWSSLWGVQSSRYGVVALRGPCKSGSCIYVRQRWQGVWRSRTPLDGVLACALRRSGSHMEIPDPSRGEVRAFGC